MITFLVVWLKLLLSWFAETTSSTFIMRFLDVKTGLLGLSATS